MQQTELAQSKFLCGRQKFKIVDGEMLDIQYTRFNFHQQFQIPLWELLPEPERIKHRPIGTAAGVVIFGIMILAMMILPFFIGDLALALVFPALFIVPFFIACTYKLKTTSIDGLLFHLRNGGYIQIWYENPKPDAFTAFCSTLKLAVKQAHDAHAAAAQGHTFAAEILDLKKLADAGVLTPDEYTKLKDRIVAADQRPIGFR